MTEDEIDTHVRQATRKFAAANRVLRQALKEPRKHFDQTMEAVDAARRALQPVSEYSRAQLQCGEQLSDRLFDVFAALLFEEQRTEALMNAFTFKPAA